VGAELMAAPGNDPRADLRPPLERATATLADIDRVRVVLKQKYDDYRVNPFQGALRYLVEPTRDGATVYERREMGTVEKAATGASARDAVKRFAFKVAPGTLAAGEFVVVLTGGPYDDKSPFRPVVGAPTTLEVRLVLTASEQGGETVNKAKVLDVARFVADTGLEQRNVLVPVDLTVQPGADRLEVEVRSNGGWFESALLLQRVNRAEETAPAEQQPRPPRPSQPPQPPRPPLERRPGGKPVWPEPDSERNGGDERRVPTRLTA
jgi:hypothetical protein